MTDEVKHYVVTMTYFDGEVITVQLSTMTRVVRFLESLSTNKVFWVEEACEPHNGFWTESSNIRHLQVKAVSDAEGDTENEKTQKVEDEPEVDPIE